MRAEEVLFNDINEGDINSIALKAFGPFDVVEIRDKRLCALVEPND